MGRDGRRDPAKLIFDGLELDASEREWVNIFRELSEEQRDAVFQIVRAVTGRIVPGRIHIPIHPTFFVSERPPSDMV